jgi:hypothetical protein
VEKKDIVIIVTIKDPTRRFDNLAIAPTFKFKLVGSRLQVWE